MKEGFWISFIKKMIYGEFMKRPKKSNPNKDFRYLNLLEQFKTLTRKKIKI